MKLTDTQLLLLSAASQREDHGVVISPNLKGGAAQKVITKLLDARLLEELRAKGTLPVWRRDKDNAAFALRVTRAGLKAIVVEDGSEGESAEPAGSGPKARARLSVRPKPTVLEASALKASSEKKDQAIRKPKKIDEVVALLQRATGATMEELIAMTGWLPHTTRAALSGLRKAGHSVGREKDDAGVSRYKLATKDGAKAAGRR